MSFLLLAHPSIYHISQGRSFDNDDKSLLFYFYITGLCVWTGEKGAVGKSEWVMGVGDWRAGGKEWMIRLAIRS